MTTRRRAGSTRSRTCPERPSVPPRSCRCGGNRRSQRLLRPIGAAAGLTECERKRGCIKRAPGRAMWLAPALLPGWGNAREPLDRSLTGQRREAHLRYAVLALRPATLAGSSQPDHGVVLPRRLNRIQVVHHPVQQFADQQLVACPPQVVGSGEEVRIKNGLAPANQTRLKFHLVQKLSTRYWI